MPQASIENLRSAGASPTITDLTSDGSMRPLTGVQMAGNISDMFLNMNVTEWESNMEGIDMPDFYITFAAIVSSTLTLSYPDFVVEMIAAPLFDGFNVDQEIRNFILIEYLPEVKGLVTCHVPCFYNRVILPVQGAHLGTFYLAT